MFIICLLVQLDFRSPAGYDRTRGVEIGNKNFKLTHLEEAYTSEHWLVRIYKVKDLVNREKVEKPTIPGQKWKKKSSKKVSFSEIQLRINFVWNRHEFSINYKCMQAIQKDWVLSQNQTYTRYVSLGPAEHQENDLKIKCFFFRHQGKELVVLRINPKLWKGKEDQPKSKKIHAWQELSFLYLCLVNIVGNIGDHLPGAKYVFVLVNLYVCVCIIVNLRLG